MKHEDIQVLFEYWSYGDYGVKPLGHIDKNLLNKGLVEPIEYDKTKYKITPIGDILICFIYLFSQIYIAATQIILSIAKLIK